jgi:hypothetical protein
MMTGQPELSLRLKLAAQEFEKGIQPFFYFLPIPEASRRVH